MIWWSPFKASRSDLSRTALVDCSSCYIFNILVAVLSCCWMSLKWLILLSDVGGQWSGRTIMNIRKTISPLDEDMTWPSTNFRLMAWGLWLMPSIPWLFSSARLLSRPGAWKLSVSGSFSRGFPLCQVAVSYIQDSVHFDKNIEVSTFEVNIRCLGWRFAFPKVSPSEWNTKSPCWW